MTHTSTMETSTPVLRDLSPIYELTNRLLGGRPALRRLVRDERDAHLLISQGLPTQAMLRLASGLHQVPVASLLVIMGMSQRNFQRRKEAAERDPAASLTLEEGSRLWKFTEILAQATQTLGSQEAAEKWLNSPQVGLDGKRPMELLTTPPGAELVEELLLRMEYGVYA